MPKYQKVIISSEINSLVINCLGIICIGIIKLREFVESAQLV